MLKLEPRLIANTNMTEEILKYVGSGTGWARVIMLKSLEERFQKCIFWVRFNIRNSQKFQFKPGCFHQHFTVMEKPPAWIVRHPPHWTSTTLCVKQDIYHIVHPPHWIEYILPTIWGYMSVGGCLCALRAQGKRICIFLNKYVSLEYGLGWY